MEAQNKLDSNTFDAKNLDYDKTSPERFLALIVELNEFANATKVFKYWSLQSSDREHTLDEFADVFHFILAIFLEKKIDPTDIVYPQISQKNKRDITLNLLSLISSIHYPMSEEDFKDWVCRFFQLTSSYGFSYEDLERAYWRKWNVNLERQRSGY